MFDKEKITISVLVGVMVLSMSVYPATATTSTTSIDTGRINEYTDQDPYRQTTNSLSRGIEKTRKDVESQGQNDTGVPDDLGYTEPYLSTLDVSINNLHSQNGRVNLAVNISGTLDKGQLPWTFPINTTVETGDRSYHRTVYLKPTTENLYNGSVVFQIEYNQNATQSHEIYVKADSIEKTVEKTKNIQVEGEYDHSGNADIGVISNLDIYQPPSRLSMVTRYRSVVPQQVNGYMESTSVPINGTPSGEVDNFPAARDSKNDKYSMFDSTGDKLNLGTLTTKVPTSSTQTLVFHYDPVTGDDLKAKITDAKGNTLKEYKLKSTPDSTNCYNSAREDGVVCIYRANEEVEEFLNERHELYTTYEGPQNSRMGLYCQQVISGGLPQNLNEICGFDQGNTTNNPLFVLENLALARDDTPYNNTMNESVSRYHNEVDRDARDRVDSGNGNQTLYGFSGEKLDLKADVRNVGDKTGNDTVRLSIAGGFDGMVEKDVEIKPGETETVVFNDLPTSVVNRSDREIVEDIRTNNVSSGSITDYTVELLGFGKSESMKFDGDITNPGDGDTYLGGPYNVCVEGEGSRNVVVGYQNIVSDQDPGSEWQKRGSSVSESDRIWETKLENVPVPSDGGSGGTPSFVEEAREQLPFHENSTDKWSMVNYSFYNKRPQFETKYNEEPKGDGWSKTGDTRAVEFDGEYTSDTVQPITSDQYDRNGSGPNLRGNGWYLEERQDTQNPPWSGGSGAMPQNLVARDGADRVDYVGSKGPFTNITPTQGNDWREIQENVTKVVEGYSQPALYKTFVRYENGSPQDAIPGGLWQRAIEKEFKNGTKAVKYTKPNFIYSNRSAWKYMIDRNFYSWRKPRTKEADIYRRHIGDVEVRFKNSENGDVFYGPHYRKKSNYTNSTIELQVMGELDYDPVFRWEFEDGTTMRGRSVNKTYTEPGTHNVTVRYDTPSGDTETMSTRVTVGESPLCQQESRLDVEVTEKRNLVNYEFGDISFEVKLDGDVTDKWRVKVYPKNKPGEAKTIWENRDVVYDGDRAEVINGWYNPQRHGLSSGEVHEMVVEAESTTTDSASNTSFYTFVCSSESAAENRCPTRPYVPIPEICEEAPVQQCAKPYTDNEDYDPDPSGPDSPSCNNDTYVIDRKRYCGLGDYNRSVDAGDLTKFGLRWNETEHFDKNLQQRGVMDEVGSLGSRQYLKLGYSPSSSKKFNRTYRDYGAIVAKGNESEEEEKLMNTRLDFAESVLLSDWYEGKTPPFTAREIGDMLEYLRTGGDDLRGKIRNGTLDGYGFGFRNNVSESMVGYYPMDRMNYSRWTSGVLVNEMLDKGVHAKAVDPVGKQEFVLNNLCRSSSECNSSMAGGTPVYGNFSFRNPLPNVGLVKTVAENLGGAGVPPKKDNLYVMGEGRGVFDKNSPFNVTRESTGKVVSIVSNNQCTRAHTKTESVGDEFSFANPRITLCYPVKSGYQTSIPKESGNISFISDHFAYNPEKQYSETNYVKYADTDSSSIEYSTAFWFKMPNRSYQGMQGWLDVSKGDAGSSHNLVVKTDETGDGKTRVIARNEKDIANGKPLTESLVDKTIPHNIYDGKWHHMTIAYRHNDGNSDVSLRIDNQQPIHKSYSNTELSNSLATSGFDKFDIGATWQRDGSGKPRRYYEGSYAQPIIDEVRLYNRYIGTEAATKYMTLKGKSEDPNYDSSQRYVGNATLNIQPYRIRGKPAYVKPNDLTLTLEGKNLGVKNNDTYLSLELLAFRSTTLGDKRKFVQTAQQKIPLNSPQVKEVRGGYRVNISGMPENETYRYYTVDLHLESNTVTKSPEIDNIRIVREKDLSAEMIAALERPIPDISVNKSGYRDGETLKLTAKGSYSYNDPIDRYKWIFEDSDDQNKTGGVENYQTVTHEFEGESEQVKLVVWDTDGDQNSITRNITSNMSSEIPDDPKAVVDVAANGLGDLQVWKDGKKNHTISSNENHYGITGNSMLLRPETPETPGTYPYRYKWYIGKATRDNQSTGDPDIWWNKKESLKLTDKSPDSANYKLLEPTILNDSKGMASVNVTLAYREPTEQLGDTTYTTTEIKILGEGVDGKTVKWNTTRDFLCVSENYSDETGNYTTTHAGMCFKDDVPIPVDP